MQSMSLASDKTNVVSSMHVCTFPDKLIAYHISLPGPPMDTQMTQWTFSK